MRELIARELAACEPERRQIFERYGVPLHRVPIFRYGRRESVFVVAIKDGEALYWEDVEEGFNLSPLSDAGELLEHWCDHYTLREALYAWTPGAKVRSKLGPAEPL